MPPSETLTLPTDGRPPPLDPSMPPLDDSILPQEGSILPQEGSILPQEGSILSLDPLTPPTEGSTLPWDLLTPPTRGSTVPLLRRKASCIPSKRALHLAMGDPLDACLDRNRQFVRATENPRFVAATLSGRARAAREFPDYFGRLSAGTQYARPGIPCSPCFDDGLFSGPARASSRSSFWFRARHGRKPVRTSPSASFSRSIGTAQEAPIYPRTNIRFGRTISIQRPSITPTAPRTSTFSSTSTFRAYRAPTRCRCGSGRPTARNSPRVRPLLARRVAGP
jgi:hypothetical protein